jgi:dinuclear metal center YbgI/SA1388 family protein
MTVGAIIDYLEEIAPSNYQMSYDNSGLLVGSRKVEVSNVLICLDCIESVVDEAIEKECNLIIAHHPIIFSGLKRLTGATYIERTVIKAIQNGISIYAIHTNLDSVLENGVNTEISDRLGLIDRKILSSDLSLNAEGKVGAGMIGKLASPKETLDFLSFLKDRMGVNIIKHTRITHKTVQTVAICGGAGRFLLEEAKQQNADIFISSDFKYHEYFDAEDRIIIADIGHYESEQYTIDLIHRLITKKFSTFAPLKTSLLTNPVSYF